MPGEQQPAGTDLGDQVAATLLRLIGGAAERDRALDAAPANRLEADDDPDSHTPGLRSRIEPDPSADLVDVSTIPITAALPYSYSYRDCYRERG